MTPADEALDQHLRRALSGSGDRAALRERGESLAWIAAHSDRAFPLVSAAVRGGADALDGPRWIAVLGRLEHAEVDTLLARTLSHAGEDAALAAGLALGARPGDAARAALQSALSNEASFVRTAAVLGLGLRADPATGPALHERCADRDPIVRYHAVRAAHRVGALGRDELERLAIDDPDADVRGLARELARSD